MGSTPTVVADYECHTGECPVWHPDHEALYWIDIPRGRLFRYRPGADEHDVCHEGEPLRAVTIEDDDTLLLFEERGTVKRWSETSVEPVEIEGPPFDEFRFNDVIAGPAGRVFCGVMPEEHRPGALFRLDRGGTMVPLIDDVAFPNGMGFGLAMERFYFTDSYANAIYEFAYDAESGELSDRRQFADTEDDEGVPDGLAVDADGYVWSARWDGGSVVRYDPDGQRVRMVDVPARKVTSLAFGGPRYRSAYLTTALASSSDPIGTKAEEGEGAGALLGADLGAGGTPSFRSRIDRP